MCFSHFPSFSFFFFTAPPTPEIYTLSLHDALPISGAAVRHVPGHRCHRRDLMLCPGVVRRGEARGVVVDGERIAHNRDRKSTRLNSSHRCISYAVFCLKKKKKKKRIQEILKNTIAE